MAWGAPATEFWTGTLEVQGREFDVTPPTLTLHGAVSKTARAREGARSARVTFKVTATDGVDGAVPVSCQSRGRVPLRARPDEGALRDDRLERQRREHVVHRHRAATAVTPPP
jgi:hypothetical protein